MRKAGLSRVPRHRGASSLFGSQHAVQSWRSDSCSSKQVLALLGAQSRAVRTMNQRSGRDTRSIILPNNSARLSKDLRCVPLVVGCQQFRGRSAKEYHSSVRQSNDSAHPARENEPNYDKVTPTQLFRYLKEAAEREDKEAQFRLGCMLCLGEDALRIESTDASSDLSEEEREERDAAALIQLEQLDFILGEGYVVPKDKDAFEKTKITNWKQWLKREREKLKQRKTAGTEGALPPQEQENESHSDDRIAVDYAQAANWFQRSAAQNHPLAQYFLGTFYLKGLGVEHSVEKALDLLQKSAQQGNALSCYDLGQLYYEGTKVQQDIQKSREYFEKAVEYGNTNAMYWLGFCYHRGVDCEPAAETAFKLLETAAEKLHPGAIFYVAMMYRTGEGVEKNEGKMLHYLKMGAELEDSECLRCLADIYFHGTDGVDVDYPLALQYYHQAGLQGDADALCCEGVMHFKGLGTEQSYTRAFYAYQASALTDNPAACRNLSYLYKQGLGCAQSDVNADFYLKRAEEIMEQQRQAEHQHHEGCGHDHHHHHEGCGHDHQHDETCDHDHHHDHQHDETCNHKH